jgi:predicted enzyme related to lactoylglutathione lyase
MVNGSASVESSPVRAGEALCHDHGVGDERAQPVGWLRGVIFDAVDPPRLARFWCELLGVELDERLSEPPNWLQTTTGRGGVLLGFQPVEPGDAPRPRIRLDIEVPELDGPSARAEALGARLLEVVHFRPGEEHRVFADPEGNELNLVLPFPPA